MHQQPSKKKKRIELTITYLVMSLAVVGLVMVLALVVQGYRFNKFDGKIEQGGLLQYDSRPTGAQVYLDGVKLEGLTPEKITVSAGSHTVRMSRQGYVDWQKQVYVTAGSVLWLNYTRFMPTKSTIESPLKLAELKYTLPSPNQKRIVVVTNSASSELSIVSIDSSTPELTTIPLESSMLTVPTDPASQSIEPIAWDADNRYVLVKRTYDAQVEWLVVDVTNKKVVHNVTSELGVTIRLAQFAHDDTGALYVVSDTNELRRIDLDAKSVSGPLLRNVAEFNQFDRSTIVYSQLFDPTTKVRSVGYLTRGADTPRTIKTYADDGTIDLHMAIGRYYNRSYVTIAYGETVDVLTGDLPSSDNRNGSVLIPVTMLSVPGGVKYLGFSPGGNRQIYAQSADKLVTYDIELKKPATTQFGSVVSSSIYWVDAYHFVVNAGGSLMMYEFDGANMAALTESTTQQVALFSPSGNYLYMFTGSGESASLSRLVIRQ